MNPQPVETRTEAAFPAVLGAIILIPLALVAVAFMVIGLPVLLILGLQILFGKREAPQIGAWVAGWKNLSDNAQLGIVIAGFFAALFTIAAVGAVATSILSAVGLIR